MPSYQHEKAVVDYLSELRDQGWKTINLKGKIPDGIAIKDNKIIAIEVLLVDTGIGGHTSRLKREQYFMFDDVFVKKIKRDKDFDKKRKIEEDNIYQNIRKLRDEEKINKVWNRYG